MWERADVSGLRGLVLHSSGTYRTVTRSLSERVAGTPWDDTVGGAPWDGPGNKDGNNMRPLRGDAFSHMEYTSNRVLMVRGS